MMGPVSNPRPSSLTETCTPRLRSLTTRTKTCPLRWLQKPCSTEFDTSSSTTRSTVFSCVKGQAPSNLTSSCTTSTRQLPVATILSQYACTNLSNDDFCTQGVCETFLTMVLLKIDGSGRAFVLPPRGDRLMMVILGIFHE